MPAPKRFLAFDVRINGKRVCTAGHRNHAVLAAALAWTPGAPKPMDCTFNVGGLIPRGRKVTSTSWIDRMDLKPGDEIVIRILSTQRASRPASTKTEPALDRPSKRRRLTRR